LIGQKAVAAWRLLKVSALPAAFQAKILPVLVPAFRRERPIAQIWP